LGVVFYKIKWDLNGRSNLEVQNASESSIFLTVVIAIFDCGASPFIRTKKQLLTFYGWELFFIVKRRNELFIATPLFLVVIDFI
jgi:hypothetical protein